MAKWTKQEEDLLNVLKVKYIDDILEYFPNRDRQSIYRKCIRMGIKLETKSAKHNFWNDNELQLLLDNYEGKTTQELSKIITTRTEDSILKKCKDLNLFIKKNPKYNEKKTVIECNVCKTQKEYNETNFIRNSNVCRECSKKINSIKKYKAKHDIELDFNKMFDTYTPVEWYKIVREKNMKMLPIEVVTKENVAQIVKHITRNELNLEKKEDILKIRSIDLPRFTKLRFETHYDLMNFTFSEFNIKPWELIEVPKNFWNNKENADNYIQWFIENKFIYDNMNIKNEVSKMFNISNLRRIGENMLPYFLQVKKYYKSFYEWLNKLYPEWKLSKDDFKDNISFDGNTFDSLEELQVYELIKKEYKLDIKAMGRKKGIKFNNELYNENYVVDFKIINNRIDRPIISEYFGWFHEKPKNEMLIQYRDKTFRKEEYFNSLNDYYFISFYPQDLKNNFQGVREKLTSFFMSNFNIDIDKEKNGQQT